MQLNGVLTDTARDAESGPAGAQYQTFTLYIQRRENYKVLDVLMFVAEE